MKRSTLVSFALGGLVGLGSGYVGFKPTTTRCQEYIQQSITELEEKYQNIAPTPGLALARDLSLEYAVSESAPFRGLVFTDTASGKRGVITKNQFFGNTNYDLVFDEIAAALGSAERIPITPTIKVYSSAKK